VPRSKVNKDILAHQRISDHEKLCRIMQEETNKKISALQHDISRIDFTLLILREKINTTISITHETTATAHEPIM